MRSRRLWITLISILQSSKVTKVTHVDATGVAAENRPQARKLMLTGQGHIATRALDILDERFARGEIEKAEYAEKKQLTSQRSGPERDPSQLR
jgi:uncharacterized membrane protein